VTRLRAFLAVTAVIAAAVVMWPGAAVAAGDITARIRAGQDVTLGGAAVIRLNGGETVSYPGVPSGRGTVTVAGSGRLILTKDSDFTPATTRQRIVTYNGNHPLTRVDDPDPPAVTVARGVTLQYGPGEGATGQLAHYVAVPGARWNTLNHRVDGTLDVAVHAPVHLGIMSGDGLIKAREFTWPGLSLAGAHPFSGEIYNGTGFDFGTNAYVTRLPNLRTVLNRGSAIHGAAGGQTTVSRANYWSRVYGNDINYHTWGSGVVRNTGVYSWSDRGPDTDPSLSDPALNFAAVAHRNNKRGINIEGASVEWGDGTTDRFFLPGNASTAYINMHFDGRERSRLTLNYNGPVTLGVPISGGRYHDTLAAPGQGDVVIAGTEGNEVTFAAPQNYDGSTTIGSGATLRLGTGKPAGDSGLRRGPGTRVIDNGALILRNARTPLTLARISGNGSLTQAGPAAVTLTGALTYRGATTVTAGTLKLTGGTLASSRAVTLSGGTLDLTRAGEQTVTDLSGAAAATVLLRRTLTVRAATPTGFAGTIRGGDLTKTGPAALTLSGPVTALLTVREGSLRIDGAVTGDVAVGASASLAGGGAIRGAVTNRGEVTGGLTIDGDYRQAAPASLTGAGLTVSGQVTLAGRLTAPDGDGDVTVLDNTGDAPVTGTFDDLPEGAKVGDRVLSYTGGDGNDVVLTGPSAAAGGVVAALGGETRRFPVPLPALGLGLVVAALVIGVRRRRRPTGVQSPSSGPE
jgi:autotransporter-associated beta strand protein